MTGSVNVLELVIVAFFFILVAVVGFAAARWRRAESMLHLNEWGLGGRSFGTFVTWFLLGGDLYTAYTFVAVPAAVLGAGATGFFAVPYTIVSYPLIFIFMVKLWSVSHVHGYVTPADFVRGRFGSKTLATVVAVTGILATMPYIALQLVGIQVVLASIGIGGGSDSWLVNDLPLFIAFAVLAAYTYTSGLRAPAMIAFIKDTLIYIVIIVAIIYIPIKLGGFGHIFDVAGKHLSSINPATHKPFGGVIPEAAKSQWAIGTLAIGSAMALFMYPHSITGVLASKSRNIIRRNSAILPAYSFMLALLAMLGFMAIAAPGVLGVIKKAGGNAQLAVPALFQWAFPSWFTGVAFAAIGIGALVPAAIMSIAASNLFTRNIYKEFFRPNAEPAEEARVSKVVSLIVKVGALLFVLLMDKSFAINLQLLGGIWILQTFPAIVFGLYTRWFHRWALVAGWAVSMAYGTIAAYGVPVPGKPGTHFGGSTAPVPFLGTLNPDLFGSWYIALTGFLFNVIIAVVLTLILKALKAPEGKDETKEADYEADAGEPGVEELPEPAAS